MAREVTGAMRDVLSSERAELIYMIEAEFDSGTDRFCTNDADIVWDGKTFVAAGNLLAMSPAEETTQTVATKITVQLSGVNEDTLSIVLGENYQGRRFTAWLAAKASPSTVGKLPSGCRVDSQSSTPGSSPG